METKPKYPTVKAKYLKVNPKYPTVKAKYLNFNPKYPTVKAKYPTVKAKLIEMALNPYKFYCMSFYFKNYLF